MDKKIYAVILILATLGSIAIVSAIATYPWNGTVGVPEGQTPPTPTPAPTPEPTATFLVSASSADGRLTISADSKTVVIPEGAYIGSTYEVIYTITSTANQQITITPAATIEPSTGTGITATWDKETLTLNTEESNTITLTVTVGTSAGTINVNFVATGVA